MISTWNLDIHINKKQRVSTSERVSTVNLYQKNTKWSSISSYYSSWGEIYEKKTKNWTKFPKK